LGLRRFETESELVDKNDSDVLKENRGHKDELTSLEYELSKLFALN